MANRLDRFKNPRMQRILVRLTPFVGLVGTTYGIVRAFSMLDRRVPSDPIVPGILVAVLEGIVVGFILVPIVCLSCSSGIGFPTNNIDCALVCKHEACFDDYRTVLQIFLS
jgi:MotA/TolQ/ExbB proton channel family